MRFDGRVAGLLVVAFVLRLASNHWLTNPSPAIESDALWYHSTATSLSQGLGYVHHFTRQPTAAWPPGYPAILAAVYSALGADPKWAFLLNAIAGTLTCWLAGLIALATLSRRAQLTATALMALMPSHVLFASLVLSETVFTTAMTALVLGAIAAMRARSVWGWFAWGIGVGLASLVRAEAVVLLAAPVLALLLAGASARRVGAVFALAALATVLAQLPWLVRNAKLFGRVVPVSTSFGRTFLIGHNPVADGGMNMYSPDPVADNLDLASGVPARELAVDERLRAEGLRFVRENPATEVALVGKRFWKMFRADRVWSEWYVPGDPSRITATTIERLGVVSNLYYWLLLLAAAPGLMRFATRRDQAHLLLPLVLVTWTAFFVVVLYGTQRFHFPLIPLLCVLAAATLEKGVRPLFR